MRTSSSVGDALRLSSAVADMIMPGVQNPHCTPPSSSSACCSGCSSSPTITPSTVVIGRSAAWAARYEHELTG